MGTLMACVVRQAAEPGRELPDGQPGAVDGERVVAARRPGGECRGAGGQHGQ